MKRLFSKLILIFFVSSFTLIGTTWANYSDDEQNEVNTLSTANLDFTVQNTLIPPDPNVCSDSRLIPGSSVEDTVTINKSGTSDFFYQFLIKDSSDLCQVIDVEATQNGTVFYDGPLPDLSLPDSFWMNDPSTAWNLKFSLNSDDPQYENQTCTYKLEVKGWQRNSDGTWGYFDTEEILGTLKTGDWTAPVLSNINVTSITETSAIITWKTNELATSQVEYGETDEYGLTSTLDSTLVLNHSVSITGLEAGKTYHFRILSDDVCQNNRCGLDNNFQTVALEGQVVINEIMWMGSSVSWADEWIELRNMTDHTIDIGQWYLKNVRTGEGTQDIMIPASKTIAPYGYFLIANYPETAANSALNVPVDEVNNSMTLENPPGGNGVIRLTTHAGIVVDEALATPWPAGSNSPDTKKSMERNSIPGDGLLPSSWHTCNDEVCNDGTYWDTANGGNYGTPGSENHSDETPIVEELVIDKKEDSEDNSEVEVENTLGPIILPDKKETTDSSELTENEN